MSGTMAPTQKEEMVVALARASIYNLLATVYTDAPSRGLAKAVRDGTIAQSLQTWGISSCALDQYVGGKGAEDLAEDLDVEYTRLFVAAGAGYVAPYASLHVADPDDALSPSSRSGKGQLWGAPAVQARSLYREAGLDVDERFAYVPDHLGLELQFMHHLCSRAARARAEGMLDEVERQVTLQGRFLRNHLLAWLPAFTGAVLQETAHPFFRAMAQLTLHVVESDAEQLGGQCGGLGEAREC